MRKRLKDYTGISIYRKTKSRILDYKPDRMSDADFLEDILTDKDIGNLLSKKHKRKHNNEQILEQDLHLFKRKIGE